MNESWKNFFARIVCLIFIALGIFLYMDPSKGETYNKVMKFCNEDLNPNSNHVSRAERKGKIIQMIGRNTVPYIWTPWGAGTIVVLSSLMFVGTFIPDSILDD